LHFGSTNDTVTTITGITGVGLTAGTAYFLYITPGAADTDDDWNQNLTGVVGKVTLFCSQPPPFCPNTHSATLGAFDVIGGAATTTPLPAALPLFATGLGALGLLGWRRKRKSRVSLLGVAQQTQYQLESRGNAKGGDHESIVYSRRMCAARCNRRRERSNNHGELDSDRRR
jgi:hypothetical protein